MDNSTELLQKILQDKIDALDRERVAQLAKFNKEQAEVLTIEAAERAERARKYKEAEDRVLARKLQMEKEEALRVQAATEARAQMEIAQNEAMELVKKQKAKLEWLENEISKVDFANEQHRKSMSPRIRERVVRSEEESVEAHKLTGEAAVGTEGLDHCADISSHLRSILRRANSDVNK